jgi:hypothetical protein
MLTISLLPYISNGYEKGSAGFAKALLIRDFSKIIVTHPGQERIRTM